MTTAMQSQANQPPQENMTFNSNQNINTSSQHSGLMSMSQDQSDLQLVNNLNIKV